MDLKQIIESHYNLGEVHSSEKLDKGLVNTSYLVQTMAGKTVSKYVLRKYKAGTPPAKIDFEHALLQHLSDKNFSIACSLQPTKEGQTYWIEPPATAQAGNAIYAVFAWLPGENPYRWDNPNCTFKELSNAAKTLAQYHAHVSDWRPLGKVSPPPTIEILPVIQENISAYAANIPQTDFEHYLQKNQGVLLNALEQLRHALNRQDYKELPALAIHGDYHPENLLFLNQEVVGMLDFDWAKMDVRGFDVAFALVYFCVGWQKKQDGALDLVKVALFLESYQNALKNDKSPGPLNILEREFLLPLLEAANLYLLAWGLEDYETAPENSKKSLVYLKHNVQLIRWLKDSQHQAALRKIFKSLP